MTDGAMTDINPKPVKAERRSFSRFARRLSHRLRGHEVLPWGAAWLSHGGQSRRISQDYACVTCDMDL